MVEGARVSSCPVRDTMSVWTVTLIAVLALASMASAQAGTDVVRLANGGRLRGTVEVYEPGHDVVIVLSDGTRRTIPAADVAEVIFGDTIVPPAGAPPTSEVPAVPPDVVPPGTPEVSPIGPEVVAPPPPVDITPPPVSTPPPTTSSPPLVGPSTPRTAPSEEDGMPAVQHLGAVESIAGVPEGPSRTYEAPRDLSATAWLDDPSRAEIPEGILHLGVELRGTLRFPAYGGDWVGGGEVSGVFDLRPLSRFHLRVALLLGVTNNDFRSRIDAYYASQSGSGALQFGARFLLGFDVARFFQLRFGGEVGGDYVPAVNQFPLYFAPEIEASGLLTDDGRLEMGLSVSAPYVPYCTTSLSVGVPQSTSCFEFFYPRLQILVGYHFL